MQARIQEFSSGGPTFQKILTSQKKKKKKGEEETKQGFGCSFTSAKLWCKSTFKTIVYIQIYFRTFIYISVGNGLLYNCKRGSFLYSKCVGEGGLGVLPQKIFGFNGVKSCKLRQKKYENVLS